MDEWFETEVQPEMTIDIPGSYDVLSELASNDVVDLILEHFGITGMILVWFTARLKQNNSW